VYVFPAGFGWNGLVKDVDVDVDAAGAPVPNVDGNIGFDAFAVPALCANGVWPKGAVEGVVKVLVAAVKVLAGAVKVLVAAVKVLVGAVKVLVGAVKVLAGAVKVLAGPVKVLVKTGCDVFPEIISYIDRRSIVLSSVANNFKARVSSY